jgi:hypothetical protein
MDIFLAAPLRDLLPRSGRLSIRDGSASFSDHSIRPYLARSGRYERTSGGNSHVGGARAGQKPAHMLVLSNKRHRILNAVDGRYTH